MLDISPNCGTGSISVNVIWCVFYYRVQWVRNWGWWNYFRDYFPIKLVKTADLEPSKNYLFACYPHGVLSSGAYCSFATNALNFHKLFPGLTPHLIVLGGHFLFPFFRDLILSLGTCASSQESLLHLLNPKRFQGNCVAIMVGGAAEALDSHPGKYKIILSRRKGFIRIAMKSGYVIFMLALAQLSKLEPRKSVNNQNAT